MLKPNDNKRSTTEELIMMRLTNWAERVGTMLLETPQGDWYAVMWKFDRSFNTAARPSSPPIRR